MRFSADDLADMKPFLQEIIRATVAELRAAEQTAGEQLAFTEVQAGAALGVAPHVIRQARRDGKINGVKVGRAWLYPRTEIVRAIAVEKSEQRSRAFRSAKSQYRRTREVRHYNSCLNENGIEVFECPGCGGDFPESEMQNLHGLGYFVCCQACWADKVSAEQRIHMSLDAAPAEEGGLNVVHAIEELRDIKAKEFRATDGHDFRDACTDCDPEQHREWAESRRRYELKVQHQPTRKKNAG